MTAYRRAARALRARPRSRDAAPARGRPRRRGRTCGARSSRSTPSRRRFEQLWRDEHLDVWVISWMPGTTPASTTTTSRRARSPSSRGHPRGAGWCSAARRVAAPPRRRAVFDFEPSHVHRLRQDSRGAAVSIHAYSPPLWRMGTYAVGADGSLRRSSISYAEELRPVDAAASERPSGPVAALLRCGECQSSSGPVRTSRSTRCGASRGRARTSSSRPRRSRAWIAATRASRRFVQARVAEDPGALIYGTTTAPGDGAAVALTAEAQARRPTRLWTAHSFGEPLPERVMRAIVLARLSNFVDGHAAVRGEVASAVAAMLDAPLPAVPARAMAARARSSRSAGSSTTSARAWSSRRRSGWRSSTARRAPRRSSPTSRSPGRARLALAEAVLALAVEAARAPLEAYAADLEALWDDEHEAAALRSLRALLAGGADGPPGPPGRR